MRRSGRVAPGSRRVSWRPLPVAQSERVFSVQMRQRVNWVRGPDGDTLTRNDMPPRGTRRWGLRLKARVVAGVEGGLITLVEACSWYDLSAEEYMIWRRRTLERGYPDLDWLQDAPKAPPKEEPPSS